MKRAYIRKPEADLYTARWLALAMRPLEEYEEDMREENRLGSWVITTLGYHKWKHLESVVVRLNKRFRSLA
jgi:hypothetical protein